MSKYDPETLKMMSSRLLAAKANNDDRYFQFIMTMSIYTNLSTQQIAEFANAGA